MTPPTRVLLLSDRRAPRAARRFLREAVCLEHPTGGLDHAVLLVSELVTNAVVHGSPPVALRVECDESGGLVVRVSDGSGRLPVERTSGPLEPGGRGMGLVDVLSDDWGVDQEVDDDQPGGGKTVWFRLQVDERGQRAG